MDSEPSDGDRLHPLFADGCILMARWLHLSVSARARILQHRLKILHPLQLIERARTRGRLDELRIIEATIREGQLTLTKARSTSDE